MHNFVDKNEAINTNILVIFTNGITTKVNNPLFLYDSIRKYTVHPFIITHKDLHIQPCKTQKYSPLSTDCIFVQRLHIKVFQNIERNKKLECI